MHKFVHGQKYLYFILVYGVAAMQMEKDDGLEFIQNSNFDLSLLRGSDEGPLSWNHVTGEKNHHC